MPLAGALLTDPESLEKRSFEPLRSLDLGWTLANGAEGGL
jgi:hypothetical protein